MSARIVRRACQGTPQGWGASVHPVLQRVYAARGVLIPADASHRLKHLLSPRALGGLQAAVDLLAQAIAADWTILVAGDYDCDGATGTAVAVRGLRLLGARRVDFAVPHRFAHGYGLSEAFVASLDPAPRLLITVDNGVASVAGVAAAKARGCRVLVTDHHLPGAVLPAADAMVNPNLDGDGFTSKALAGVGVMFYLLLALRARMYADAPAACERPDLACLLDLVALGTVADLVPLDFNNRILVEAGLKRIRAGRACAGIQALFAIAGRDAPAASARDLGFFVGPRINAAGRLQDMRTGVRCLLADDPGEAEVLAARLDAINRERRELQADMLAEAEHWLAGLDAGSTPAAGVSVYEASWHAGVVGLVASRLKDRLHRPVVAFAPAGPDQPDELRGSARSVPGFHLRDALAAIDARQPGLILRFGGHAMAAGLSLRAVDVERFAAAFEAHAQANLAPELRHALIHTDGSLAPGEACTALADQLDAAGPWGQGFPEPLFDDRFECTAWRRVGSGHWRLDLRDPRDGSAFEAMMFHPPQGDPPRHLHAAYELNVDAWRGRRSLRLMLRHVEAI